MLLKNCRLIPELSADSKLKYADVLISEDKIARITQAGGGMKSPEGETPCQAGRANGGANRSAGEEIDCGGMTLLPGLIDLHTHIDMRAGLYGIRTTENPMRLVLENCRRVQTYLDYGYTTIRDLGSARRCGIYVRDAVESGLIPGPRIISSGYIIMPTLKDCDNPAFDIFNRADGADAVRRAVREEAAEGADLIKIYASGSVQSQHPIYTREEVRTAVETAAAKGLYVAAHTHDAEAIRLCLEEGVRTIEHGTDIDQECLRLFADRPEAALIPTFSAMNHREDTAVGGQAAQMAKFLHEILLRAAENIGAAYRAGVKIGWGTDIDIETCDTRVGIEFRYRSEYCRMDNVDILLQATKNSAEIAGLSGTTGEVREGLCADLLLVDGNPDEDISVMYQKPVMVFAKGARVR